MDARSKMTVAVASLMVFSLFAVSFFAAEAAFTPPAEIPQNEDTPFLIVLSPINQVYYADHIPIKINITKPASWYNVSAGGFIEFKGVVNNVTYCLDGGETLNLAVSDDMNNTVPMQLMGNLTDLTAGIHTLNVTEYATCYYAPDMLGDSPDYNATYSTVLEPDSCEVLFEVILPTDTPSESPTASITPTAIPSAQVENGPFAPAVIIAAIVAVLVIVIVVVGIRLRKTQRRHHRRR